LPHNSVTSPRPFQLSFVLLQIPSSNKDVKNDKMKEKRKRS